MTVIHPQVLPWFPEYNYRNPAGDRAVLCDYRNPNNAVGHQQRAFSVWWALATCGPLDLGLDVGSHRGLTPYCIHVDAYGGGASHPYYGGGPYRSDIVLDASDLSSVFPADTFPLVASNHSLEHMAATQWGGGDAGIVEVLKGWIRVLRPGGVLAMVVPDNDCFNVLASDRDHRHAWGHSDFRQRVLDRALAEAGAVLEEFDTFKNNFSFDVVARKKC